MSGVPASGAAARPVVTRYTGAARAKVAMPIGGIGTGCVSLGGRGQLIDGEYFNRPARGADAGVFFAVRIADPGAPDGTPSLHTRVLEASLLPAERDGEWGSPSTFAGLPRFADSVFEAAYPFGRVALSDPAIPIRAWIEGFNPVVPGDADASGYPAAVLRVRFENPTDRPLEVSLAASLQNQLGRERDPHGYWRIPDGNRFATARAPGVNGVLGTTAVAGDHEAWGTFALAFLDVPVASRRTTWAHRSWGDALLDFWDDFAADGRVHEPGDSARVPTASLTTEFALAPGDSRAVTSVLAWHAPNRRGWTMPAGPPTFSHSEVIVGNHYASRFRDAWHVVTSLAAELDDLERRTEAYVRTVADSDLPIAVQDAVLSNVAVLFSPTCFRIEDGTFLGWEGCGPYFGSCHGSCTHVWNYQYALEQLFPELAWTMREVEFVHSLDARGLMSFRAGLPLRSEGTRWRVAAADGQMGAIVRLFRTWQLTGDDARLRALWPGARRALEFAWIEKGWDADRDGVMEGCQHNTADVEYYGPNGIDQSWYLAALAGAAELADAVGDLEFARECRRLRDAGAMETDRLLFDGYYAQDVRPPGSEDAIAEGLRVRYGPENPDVGSDDLVDPDLQIGDGCMADQLVGDTMALLGGLDTGLDRAHVAEALGSIVRFNARRAFGDQLNALRTYATADEAGLVNCSYPRGGRPERPYPYWSEVWTGVEYTAAAGLATAGVRDAAEKVVRDVRGRYDGTARNPFDEIECGFHYVRSMASFGLVHAWATVVADRSTDSLTAAALPGRWPVIAGERVGALVIRGDGSARYEAAAGSDWGRLEIGP